MTKPDWAERLQRTFSRKYEAGIQAERERIIKLIEEHALDYAEITCDFNGHGVSFDEQGLIALIKGENK